MYTLETDPENTADETRTTLEQVIANLYAQARSLDPDWLRNTTEA